jgi:membrane-associated protein
MQTLMSFVDIFLHVDKHLEALVAGYGIWVYAILFLIIFCETGLVVTAILPGDSLLFAAGSLCALGSRPESQLNIFIIIPLLIVAAIIGDAVNYSIGKALGPGYLEKKNFRFVKKEHLEKTQRFYDKYGGKTIVLARFVPIVRTFAPFVAGIGKMPYPRFLMFNVVGAFAWVIICVVAGYAFGQMPIVKKNFELVILAIIFLSILPIVIEALKARNAKDPIPGARAS